MSFSRAAFQLERRAIAFYPASCKARRNWVSLPSDRRVCARTFSQSPHPVLSDRFHDVQRSPDKTLTEIHSQVHNALSLLAESSPPRHPLEESRVLYVLDILARSARPRDLALIEKILENFSSLCGPSVTAEVHDHIIRGLLKHGNPQTLLNWLAQMRQKPGKVQPCLRHWHMFFEHCADVGHVGIIKTALSKMAYSGCPPNNRIFKILFKAMFDWGATMQDFLRIFDTIEQYTFWYDEDTANMLHDGFANLNQLKQATQIKKEFDRRFCNRVIKESPRLSEWEEDLELEVERHGLVAALKLCKALEKRGYKVHHRTLSILLRRSHHTSDLEYTKKALNLEASSSHWSIIITNAVRAGDLATALSSYGQFRSTGLPLSAPLVQPLISALCNSASRCNHDEQIDHALELYNDLARAILPSSPNAVFLRGDTGFMRERSTGPDAYMYGTLLRAMGTSADVQKYSEVALSLLAEMEARAIPFQNHTILSSLIVIAMRCSSGVDEALEAYRRLARRPNAPRITTRGYQWILRTLSQLNFGEDGFLPSIWHYFEIVKDMRLSGQAVTPAIYAQLLKRLAQLAPDAPEDMKDRLAACVRRVHDHLTLDPTITPDILLWNQLMDSYQRVGLFAEAYRVWEMLLVSDNFDHASVSIILDACGFANAWPLAQKVYSRLAERSFPFNQGNWDAYVECMCRVGRLNDAVKIICLEMGKVQKEVAPNEDTVRLLLTFATRSNQQDEVLSRIQRYLPVLWERLPPELGEFVIKPTHVAAVS
ncbi:hypothetical protein SCLCIDRAFT_1207525 [Scleroderma citrinum Foug A]|uniref:Pentacotripeptide-repeat region of PRORP domain-containing protein n=1 Tax=Scleroderma citrinum Foug A TaxID=1036808 RepID=A0A0C3AZ09_9AGAM|nr:hypothetical protein SCLCIDRAFT_1207525 [Scleroderma citrinum Foug A]